MTPDGVSKSSGIPWRTAVSVILRTFGFGPITNLKYNLSIIQKRKQNRLKRMESARDSIKRFSRNSIKLLFEKRSTHPLRCCRTIWMNGCGNTMNHVHTAGSIAMGKRRCRHSWIPCHLQKRKCCSIVTTFQTKRKYDRSSDDVVTSTDTGNYAFLYLILFFTFPPGVKPLLSQLLRFESVLESCCKAIHVFRYGHSHR